MKKLMLLMGLASILTAKAEILMYEGYPTGEDGYPTTATAINGMKVSPADSIGFSATEQYWAGNYVNSPGYYAGLAYPTVFDASSYHSYPGAATLCANVGHAPTQMRQATRRFSSDVFKNRSGKVYFRMLMQADETALGRLTGADGIVALNHYAAGLLYDRVRGGLQYATDSLTAALNSGTSRNAIYYLAFGFVKGTDGSVTAGLLLRDATDVRAHYPIVANVAAGETYVCLAEIDLNAGTDGKEKIRAMIEPCSAYNPKFLYATLGASDTVEAEIANAMYYPDVLLAASGLLHTNKGVVKFDEFGVATSADDLVYIESASGSKTVMVAGNLPGIGSPNLEYGTHADVEVGTEFVPGEIFISDGVLYGCTGYTYETRGADGVWASPEMRTTQSYVLDDAADVVRITWQWAPVAYRVVVTSHGSGSERFTFSVDPLAALQEGEGRIGGYFPANAELQVTAIDGTGDDACEFKGWTGGMTSSERVISVSVAQAIDLTATFTTHWRTLSSEEGLTVTDGNWVLTLGTFAGTIDEVENPLMITGATAGSGVLDLNAINEEAGLTAPVKAIGAKAFEFRSDLVGLILAPEIRNLYRGCFQQTGIANLPDFSHIVYIEEDVFRDCGGLKGQTDFTSLVEVKNNAFNNTKLSGDLNLPNLQAANYQAFFNAAFDGALVAPKLTEVDGYAFGNLAIKSVEAESLENVGGNAFVNCTQLKTVRLSPTVKSFGAACFQGCTALETIEPSLFASSVARIEFAAFRNAGLVDAELVFGKDFAEFVKHNATDEASEAFSGSKIASADLGATSLTFLRQGLFQNCDRLTRVVLPETLTEIAANVFSVQRTDDPMLVIETKGAPPATVNAGWAANRDWKMVIRVPEKAADAWLKDTHFVPLTAIEGLEEKPNYDRIGDYRKVVGAWRNMWLSVDYKGFSVIVR